MATMPFMARARSTPSRPGEQRFPIGWPNKLLAPSIPCRGERRCGYWLCLRRAFRPRFGWRFSFEDALYVRGLEHQGMARSF